MEAFFNSVHDIKYVLDIDECALDIDDCEQRCLNFKGLYNCFCHFGYHLNDDRKTCKEGQSSIISSVLLFLYFPRTMHTIIHVYLLV
jgi:hypothetical protein